MTDILTQVYNKLSDAGLMAGYLPVFGRFTDANVATRNNPYILFRDAGTQGAQTNYVLQYPDIMLRLVDEQRNRQQARQRCVDIRQHLWDDYELPEGLYIEPIGGLSGPYEMADGREYFTFNVRLIV